LTFQVASKSLPIMKRAIVVSVAALLSRPALPCDSDNVIAIGPNGEIELKAADCQTSPVQLRSALSSARGAYANALQFLSPSTGTNACSVNGSTNNCVAYTGACSSCGNDPNAFSGELTCWCQASASRPKNQHPDLPAGASIILESQLLVDQNVDGQHINEPTWSSVKTKNGGSEQQRTYVLHSELLKQDWEDLYQNGNGDFNDYVATIDARICGKLPFPIRAFNGEMNAGCAFDCAGIFDQNCAAKFISNSDLKFHVSIGIDSSVAENREARGRALHVTLATYGTGALAGRRFAVCPTLFLKPDPRTEPATDSIYEMNYATAGIPSCTVAPANDGQPTCSAAIAPVDYSPFNVYPISLAREQSYRASSSCSARTVDDTFLFQDDRVCASNAASVHAENYELYIRDIDSELSNSVQQLGNSTFAAIRDRIEFINLVVVADPPARFFCPSGVNAGFGAINFNAVGYAAEYSLTRASNNVFIYERK
jgi:hypothetical protein